MCWEKMSQVVFLLLMISPIWFQGHYITNPSNSNNALSLIKEIPDNYHRLYCLIPPKWVL